MSVLDLAACPICQARDGLARQTTKLEGRSHITYECLRCGSVLMWLGDDLWLEADRWAYQKVGRPEMAHLLHRTMTADELRQMADPKRPVAHSQPPVTSSWEGQPREPEQVILSSREWSGESRESRGWKAPEPVAAPQARDEPLRDEGLQEEGGTRGSVPVRESVAPPESSQPRRSRGSPFLAVSVVLTMVCLLCASAAMIASSTLKPGAPLLDEVAPTETPVPAEPAAPPEPSPPPPTDTPALLFQGVTDYVASTGSYYVVGEVRNISGDNLRFVEILASFYDGNGQLVASGSTFTEISTVEGGSSAPFKLAMLDPPPSLVSYKLRSDYQATSQGPLRLEILDHRGYQADNGWYHITGEVRNPHQFSVKFPEIVASYYNAALQVVRVEVAFSEPNILQPGQTSPFEIVLVDPPGDLTEYALQTEAVPE